MEKFHTFVCILADTVSLKMGKDENTQCIKVNDVGKCPRDALLWLIAFDAASGEMDQSRASVGYRIWKEAGTR